MKCLIYHSCFQGRIGEPGMTGEKGVPGIAGPRVRFLVFFDQVGCFKSLLRIVILEVLYCSVL